MLKYAKQKRGSKSKKKGAKNTGHPVQLWRYCNPANLPRYQLRGEYRTGISREYANGTNQHRGHVCVPNCNCMGRKTWKDRDVYSEDYLAVQKTNKQIAKRVQAQMEHGARCGNCFTVLPITGQCDNC